MAKPEKKQVPSFEDILDTPSEDVTRPQPIPQGTYHCMVKGNYTPGEAPTTKNEFSEWTLGITQVQDDVDEEALTEFLKQSNGQVGRITDKTIKYRTWHTDKTIHRLKQFLTHCGIPERDENDEKLTLRERMQFAPNCQVGVHIKHKPTTDGESMFAEVDRTFKIGED
jgi:hypothetical protein